MSDEELNALDIMADLKRLVDDEGDVLSRASLQLITTLRAQLAAANARADRAEAALAAQIEAAIREVWGCCEKLEDEAYAKMKLVATDHEKGFWSAQKMTAKRIRRATPMPPHDRTALDRMLRAESEKAQSSLAKIGLEVVIFCAAYQLNIQEVFDHIAWLGKSRDMEKSE